MRKILKWATLGFTWAMLQGCAGQVKSQSSPMAIHPTQGSSQDESSWEKKARMLKEGRVVFAERILSRN